MSASFVRPVTLIACLACLPAIADDQRYNQISLRAEATSEVAHDRMHVTLYSEAQHQDPAQLAAQTTQTINKALQRARQTGEVVVSQGSRSSDFAALSKLTGELMQDLKMGSMHFSVSDAIRKQNEDALLKDAITAFRARAQLTTEALGGSDYRIVNLNLGSGGGYQPVMRSMAMKNMDALATPEIEAGTRQVSVNADGIIEVLMP